MTSGATLDLINQKKKQKKGESYKNSGVLHFTSTETIRIPTFSDYLVAGADFNVIVGIDWTGSNGHPDNATSLHHRSSTGPNQYSSAILSVCEILAAYDTDNHFPVFAIGALRDRHTYPCLNIGPNEKEAFGVQGIINAYYAYVRRQHFAAGR